MRRRSVMTVLGLVTAGLVAAAPQAQAARTAVYVGDCGDPSATSYRSISAAVSAATRPGVTIWVCPGVWEPFTVSGKTDLVVRARPVANEPPALIEGSDEGPAIAVTDGSRKVTIRGFRVDGGTTGVRVVGAKETRIESVTVTGTDNGIAVTNGSGRSVVTGNVLTGPTEGSDGGGGTELRRAEESSIGVYVLSSNGVLVAENRVSGFGGGYYVEDSSRTVLHHNGSVDAYSAGLVLDGSSDSVLRDNRTRLADVGLVVYDGSNRNVVVGSRSRSNDGPGILVDDRSSANRFDGNFAQYNDIDVVDGTGAPDMRRRGTAGTRNTWTRMTCDTSQPEDLCGRPATQKVAPFRGLGRR